MFSFLFINWNPLKGPTYIERSLTFLAAAIALAAASQTKPLTEIFSPKKGTTDKYTAAAAAAGWWTGRSTAGKKTL